MRNRGVRERMWLPAEVEFVSRHYGERGGRWVARALARSVDSVTSFARRLGLRAPRSRIGQARPGVTRAATAPRPEGPGAGSA
jgi:hypothetical protein